MWRSSVGGTGRSLQAPGETAVHPLAAAPRKASRYGAVISLARVRGPGTAATPTFSPGAGTYAEVKAVTISTTTAGATIRCTLDGSEPTFTSPVYGAPITVDAAATVKAKAFRRDFKTEPGAVALRAFREVARPR